jgi:hypothetical protein
LQDQFAGGRTPSPLMLWASAAVAVAVGVAAAVLLLDAHPRIFGATLCALSLALMLLSIVAARPIVATLAVVLSALGLGTVAISVSPHHEHRLIAIFAVWAAVYLASIAWDILRRAAPVSPLRLVVFSAAGLAFALLAEMQTRDSEWLLRAALLAAVGAIDLAFGAALVARARTGATLVLGQALALFAGSVAFCFSGATLTLVWAAMAAVVAVLAAADEDRAWLAGAAALFLVAAAHLISVDLPLAEKARELFFDSMGAHGRLRLPLVFNERALALAGSAAALFVSARAAQRATSRAFSFGSAAFLVAAHLCVLLLVVTELHNAVVATPTPPPGLDRAEFQAFVVQYAQALGHAENTLRMTTTLSWAVYAALLVAIGFGARERVHRYLGLSLFAATLGKLALYDIWNLPRVYQMMVLLAVGALLLCASFLYARFGRRLVALLRDGNVDKAAVILFVVLAGARAHAFDPSKLEFERTVENVTAPGLYHVEVDPDLYRHAHADDLADVRIAGADNAEVAWLVRRIPAPQKAEEHAVTIVDPVQLPDGSARAVLDLGAPGLKHSEVKLVVDGEGDWFRKTRIEVSTDETSWALLAEGAYVFRVTAAGNVATHTTLKYPVSDSRYLRVTLLLAASGPPVRISGATVAFVPPEAHVPMRLLPSTKPQPVATPTDAKTSEWTLDLASPGVPIAEVALDITDPAFERRALLAAANHQNYWAPIAATLLFRVAPNVAGKLAEENVRVAADGTRKRYLRLTVYNGDDAPLALRTVSPAYVAEELVFRAPAAGTYTLYVGGDVPAPTYDLAAVLQRSGEQPTLAASFGTITPNPTFGHLAKPAAPPPLSERYKLPIAIGLALLLGLLALWAVRLMRRARETQ